MRVIIILTILFSAASARAQDAAPEQAAAMRMYEAAGGEAFMDAMMTQVEASVRASLANSGLAENQDFSQQIADIMFEELQPIMAASREISIEVYAEHFTVEEMNAISDFYESPLGARMIHEMPKLLQTSMTRLQPLQAAAQQRMMTRFVALAQEYAAQQQ